MLIFEPLFNRVKTLLDSVSITINDEVILLYCEQAYNEACGICNNNNLEEDSLTNIAFLCISNLLSNSNSTIQSLSEGGRSVTFGNMTIEELRSKAIKGLSKWKKARCV